MECRDFKHENIRLEKSFLQRRKNIFNLDIEPKDALQNLKNPVVIFFRQIEQ